MMHLCLACYRGWQLLYRSSRERVGAASALDGEAAVRDELAFELHQAAEALEAFGVGVAVAGFEHADTYAGRTGGAASGFPRSSAPASPTSAATTSATPAPRCSSTKAARSTRSPSTSATDPGFTARTYAHVMRDASRRRRITISEVIRTGRAAASRRPLVDPSGAEAAISVAPSRKKSPQIERADARTRTGDPFITSEVLYQLSYVGKATQSSA
jgi:hypothetical protein